MTVPHQVQSVGDVSSSGYLVKAPTWSRKWLGMQEQEFPLHASRLDGSRGVRHAGSLGVTSDGMLPKLLTYLTQSSRPIT
jgi:hypothetical protein